MNAIELLKKQHREVDQLFAKVGSKDEQLERAIVNNLMMHSDLEKTIFYPALQAKDETKDLVPHALEEHREVEDMLGEWQSLTGQAWIIRAEEIMDAVTHHVQEEENEMFPKVEQAFSTEELEDLGNKMAQ